MGLETGSLTERERQVLEHLRQAEQLGSALSEYAKAFSLNVQDLYAGKAQLTRKGFWPKSEAAKPELLAVRVIEPTQDVGDAGVCRLTGPGGWVLECRQWPEPAWLAAVMRANDRSAS